MLNTTRKLFSDFTTLGNVIQSLSHLTNALLAHRVGTCTVLKFLQGNMNIME